MPVESTTTIPGLNDQWPLGSDPKSEGDNHIRMIKEVLQTDALSLSAPLPVTDALQVKGNTPTFELWQDDQAVDEKLWGISATGTNFTITARDDDGTAQAGSLTVVRGEGGVIDGLLSRDGVSVGYAGLPSGGSIVTRVSGDARYLQEADGDERYLQLSGGTMTGSLTTPGSVTCGFVDTDEVHSAGGSQTDPSFTFSDHQNTGMYSAELAGSGYHVPCFTVNGAYAANIAPQGTATLDIRTVITREKGDARYLRITDMFSGVFNGTNGNVITGSGFTATRDAQGEYTVTFTTPRSNANYVLLLTQTNDGTSGMANTGYKTVNGFKVKCRNSEANSVDVTSVSFMVTG